MGTGIGSDPTSWGWWWAGPCASCMRTGQRLHVWQQRGLRLRQAVVLRWFLGATFSSLKNLYLKSQISLLRHGSWPTFSGICAFSSDIYGRWSGGARQSRPRLICCFSLFARLKSSYQVCIISRGENNPSPQLFRAQRIAISWFVVLVTYAWLLWPTYEHLALYMIQDGKQGKHSFSHTTWPRGPDTH